MFLKSVPLLGYLTITGHRCYFIELSPDLFLTPQERSTLLVVNRVPVSYRRLKSYYYNKTVSN